jgi:hypothetical protein
MKPGKRGRPFIIPPGLEKESCSVCGRDIHYLFAPHGLPIPIDLDGEIHKGTCSDPEKLRKVKVKPKSRDSMRGRK